LKRVTLELGRQKPQYVFHDAEMEKGRFAARTSRYSSIKASELWRRFDTSSKKKCYDECVNRQRWRAKAHRR